MSESIAALNHGAVASVLMNFTLVTNTDGSSQCIFEHLGEFQATYIHSKNNDCKSLTLDTERPLNISITVDTFKIYLLLLDMIKFSLPLELE